MRISEALTWDELADEYDKETGGCARIQPMEVVSDWAERQTKKFFVDPKEGTIHKIINNKRKEKYHASSNKS